MTSHERMLAAIQRQEVDYLPCSFMIFGALRDRCQDQKEFIERQVALGLDPVVMLPDLPIRLHPDVSVREWQKQDAAGGPALLCKEYRTPAGTLTATVRQTSDWPHGDHVPLFDDYLIPRSEKFLVTGPADLPALRYLFASTTQDDLAAFRYGVQALKRLAEEKGLLIAGGWGGWGHKDPGAMGVDAIMWLAGMEQPIYWGLEQPELLNELITIVADWNRKRMEIYLDAGIDLFIKRAWYETTDLWSPSLYRDFMLPVLETDVAMAHQTGTAFGCIMTSGVMPLAESLRQSKVDVLIGVDPVQGKDTTLAGIKEALGGGMCLWGGVNGFLTVELGSPEQIDEAVQSAIDLLGAGGGFILSPVDNVRDTSESVWQNVETFIDAWKRHR